MRVTGIVRQVDDLGRIVIPKEIRRSVGIREGDSMEIFMDTACGIPMVCLAKYDYSLSKEAKNLFDRVVGYYNGEEKSEVMRHLEQVRLILEKGEE